MRRSKFSGFTLIELLIVIVIISVLAIATAGLTFNYLRKARDTNRIESVRSTVTILQTARSTEELTNFSFTDGAEIKNALLTYGGYTIEASNNDKCYIFGHANSGADFFVAVESEENPNTFIIKGTVDGESVVNTSNAERLVSIATTDSCASNSNLIVSPNTIEGVGNLPYTIFLLN